MSNKFFWQSGVASLALLLIPVLQAQVAEPPELAVLRQQFEKLVADRVTSAYEAGVHRLNDSYIAGVGRSIAEAKVAGDLQTVLALENEQKSISSNEPMPADDAQAVKALKNLRPIYRSQLAKLDEQRSSNQIALLTPYVAKLKYLESVLTKADRVEEAKAVLDYRESLGAVISEERSGASQVVNAGSFTNTLGMKFVPVPGTNVLFCLYPTRVKDYAACAAETPGVNGEWKTQNKDGIPISDKDDDPVVAVSWDDANAFCAWLSKKEGKSCRLPTDREWSYAVGIGAREKVTKSTTPASLSDKIENVYPWGNQWPPPKGAGNFADTTCKAKFPIQGIIAGYTDDYATTSPVMSFKPNKLGLYDMGGNVWQWCEDWYNAAKVERVLRGGSWSYSDRNILLSSGRGHAPPDRRSSSGGFRVVVVESGG